MEKMKRVIGQGGAYIYEGTITNGSLIVKIPDTLPPKYTIHEIAWQSNGNPDIYGTLSSNPESNSAIWEKIPVGTSINTAVTALKFESNSNDQVIVRAICAL